MQWLKKLQGALTLKGQRLNFDNRKAKIKWHKEITIYILQENEVTTEITMMRREKNNKKIVIHSTVLNVSSEKIGSRHWAHH